MSNHIAQAVQRERLVATLRPLGVVGVTDTSLSILSLLRPIPLAPSSPMDFGFTRLDACGRIRDAHLFGLLGWRSGVSVSVVINGSDLLATVNELGAPLDSRGRLSICGAFRKVLQITEADTVLLAADIANGRLIITPTHQLTERLFND
jgi:hypothetical protein